jgi:hypothetical protein
MNKKLKRWLSIAGLLIASGVISLAQERPTVPIQKDDTFEIIAAKPLAVKVVKGAPYSATATTEIVQTLSDGNQIIRKNEVKIFRDSAGRTRSEQTLNTIGRWEVAGEPVRMIHINDTVTGYYYELDPRTHTAVKGRNLQAQLALLKEHLASAQQDADLHQEKAPIARTMKSIELPEELDKRKQEKAAAAQKTLERGGWPMEEGRVNDERKKLENLGKQMIEGVEAVGTRSTFTIPAGEVGNLRPIVTVEETWYSPELDMMVLTKRTDPRSGETTYRLTNLNRNEPDRALFEVPADYTVTTASKVPTKIKPREEE